MTPLLVEQLIGNRYEIGEFVIVPTGFVFSQHLWPKIDYSISSRLDPSRGCIGLPLIWSTGRGEIIVHNIHRIYRGLRTS